MYPEAYYILNPQAEVLVLLWASALWTEIRWLTGSWTHYWLVHCHFAPNTWGLTSRTSLPGQVSCHLLVSVFHLKSPDILKHILSKEKHLLFYMAKAIGFSIVSFFIL